MADGLSEAATVKSLPDLNEREEQMCRDAALHIAKELRKYAPSTNLADVDVLIRGYIEILAQRVKQSGRDGGH